MARDVLRRVDVHGWSRPGYVHRRHADLLQKALEGRLRATHTTLLSPFDPLVWDRERASALWGFDYRIEQGVTLNDAALRAVARAIQRCADWHGTPEVHVRRAEPAGLLPRLRACLESPARLIPAGRS